MSLQCAPPPPSAMTVIGRYCSEPVPIATGARNHAAEDNEPLVLINQYPVDVGDEIVVQGDLDVVGLVFVTSADGAGWADEGRLPRLRRLLQNRVRTEPGP